MDDNNSDLEFHDFCTRIDKNKGYLEQKNDTSRRSPCIQKFGVIQAHDEDMSLRNYDKFQNKYDTIDGITNMSDETIPYNLDNQKAQTDYKKTKIRDDLRKVDRNGRVREKLSLLKEKAKQDYFNDLRDVQNQYDNCDSDELEDMTMDLRNDYEDLNTFLDNEYSAITGKTFIIDPTPRRKIRKRLLYDEEATEHSQKSPLNTDTFTKICKDTPQATAMKDKQIKTGIRFQSPECDQVCTPLSKRIPHFTPGSSRKQFLSRPYKTPVGNQSQLRPVPELNEPTPSPKGTFIRPMPNAPKKEKAIPVAKLTRYKPQATSTPQVPCLAQLPRDGSMSTKKLTRKSQAVSSNTESETPQNNRPPKQFPKRTFTGIKIKPKFKPITEHNLAMYKKRAQNEYMAKVTHAKRTVPVTHRTAAIDNLKKTLNDKLKRIEELPNLQKELDTKFADDVRNVTEQLNDWNDGRNDKLDSLKRNYELRTAKLVEDFEVADLEEMPKARPKMKLKIPKYNLDEYRERATCEFKKKLDNAKRNVPVCDRNAFICNLQKELNKKLQRIDKIPELAKALEAKYYEAVKRTENQFCDDNELLQEQLEFLKEEYDAKIANLDEDSIIPTCIYETGAKSPLYTSKALDCKNLFNKTGIVLDLGELPKPSCNVITRKDQILANLNRAHKSNKTNKQVLSTTNQPTTSQKQPTRPIQETVRIDKHLARKQLMEAARARAKCIRQKLKKTPSEPLVPKLPPAAAANPLRKEAAEDIFHMMLMEHEAVDMTKPPQDILEVLTKSDMPKLEIVGNAFELDNNEIVPIQIPTRDLNQLNQLQEEEIAATLQMKKHPPPGDGLAAKQLNDKKPIKIPLNKNPDYELISIPVYLNSYKYEDMFQVRGTTFPKWFPGFYSCGPQEDAPQVILRESPSEILQAAWFGMKPKRFF